jgi:hypothetical protein
VVPLWIASSNERVHAKCRRPGNVARPSRGSRGLVRAGPVFHADIVPHNGSDRHGNCDPLGSGAFSAAFRSSPRTGCRSVETHLVGHFHREGRE